MSEIPMDLVLREILTLLPAQDLLRYRCVCTVWRDTIDHPSFIQTHLDRHIENSSNGAIAQFRLSVKRFCSLSFQSDHETEIVEAKYLNHELFKNCVVSNVLANSCRGIMLVQGTDYNKYLWNPFTRQYSKLPPLGFCKTTTGNEAIGLGFDSTSDDYKVVHIDQHYDFKAESLRTRTYIYSLKLHSWRRTKAFPWKTFVSRYGVFLNGALHYIAKPCAGFIVAFDLGTEDYHLLPLPFAYTDVIDFCVLSGCLGLTCSDHAGRVNVWLMKDYGVEKSWVKLSSIGHICTGSLKPLTYSKHKDREQILIQLNNNKLHWFDLLTHSTTEVMICGSPVILSYQTCVESLVQLGFDVRGLKRPRRLDDKELQVNGKAVKL